MTDKELLELAAKAAGIEIYQSTNEGIKLRGVLGLWNPLTNSNDALWLAVKLRLDIEWDSDDDPRIETENTYMYEPNSGNPEQALRRLIVRAAAEIGKTLK